MPAIHPHTPREDYTIAGKTFSIPLPYAAGHTISANEAAALNQTWAENARNNFAKKVKEAEEAGSFDHSVFQANLDDYLSEYEFGVRTGGRSGDPVMVEALSIAREKVRAAIVKKGIPLKDVTAAQITAKAKEVVEKYPEILEKARERVAASKEIADIELGDLEPAASEEVEASDEAPAKGRKAKSEAA